MKNSIDPFRYCKETIQRYSRRILQERAGVLRCADIEPVHHMRVASRRFRAALNVFQDFLPAKKSGIWKKEIRKIGRLLGSARQLDVQIKFLRQIKMDLKKDADIVNAGAIIKSLEKKRKQVQEKIRGKLADFKAEEVFYGLKSWLKEDACGRQKHAADVFDTRKHKMAIKQLEKMLAFSAYVYKPQSVKKLHQLRIAAKKLRYTLELIRPWYGVMFEKYIWAGRDIQDQLGDLHELDVLIKTLSSFGEKGDRQFKQTLARLTRKCAGLRKDTYAGFVRLWERLEADKIWQKLRIAI